MPASIVLLCCLVLVATACRSDPLSRTPGSLSNADLDKPKAAKNGRSGEVAAGTVVDLHAGFAPDPTLYPGKTRGVVPASVVRKNCVGWIGEQPDYALRTSTAFYRLHVMLRADDSIALVVRAPDGKVSCTRRRKPKTSQVISLSVPLGTTHVWVAGLEKEAEVAYTLGLSELTANPAALKLDQPTF